MTNYPTIKTPLERHMYAEHTDKHFKFYCPLKKEGLFINVYIKKEENDIPLIFEALMDKYKIDGMSNIDAAVKAKETIEDFFSICVDLSKQGKWPFKLRVTKINSRMIKSDS